LFHYVNVNEIEGVFISPTQQEMSVVNGALQEVLLNHFYTACLQIRNFFYQSIHNKVRIVFINSIKISHKINITQQHFSYTRAAICIRGLSGIAVINFPV